MMASCLFSLHFPSLTVWKREAGLEAGRLDRGYSKRCQTVQALARDFRLGLAGGGWDSKSFFVNGTVNPTCSYSAHPLVNPTRGAKVSTYQSDGITAAFPTAFYILFSIFRTYFLDFLLSLLISLLSLPSP